MKMKHIILRDVNSNSSDFIEDFSSLSDGFLECVCVFSELERVAITEEVNGGVILLAEKWQKGTSLEVLREKFPNSKIILSSKQIKPEELMRLQYEKKSVDLFFKPKFKVSEFEDMLESLTSEPTQLTSVTSVELSLDDDVESQKTSDSNPQKNNVEATPEEIELKEVELDVDASESYEEDEDQDVEMNEEATQFTTPTIPIDLENGIDLPLDSVVESVESSVQESTNGGENSTFIKSLSSFAHESAPAQDEDEDTVVDLAKELEGIDDIMGVTSPREQVQSEDIVEHHQPVKTNTVNSQDYSHVNEIIKGKEEELLKVIARNEILDEENKLLREKVIHLEDIASRANIDQKKQSLEVDENKIKLKVLRKRHKEEINELRVRSSVLEEKINILSKHNDSLKKHNSKINRESVIDIKKVREKEDELSEKIKLMSSDFNSQLSHREQRIAELKRKIDLLDFDLQESINRESEFKERIDILENRIYDLKKSLGQSLDQLDDYSEDHIQLLKKA